MTVHTEMASQITLDAQENLKVKITIPAPSIKIYYTSRVIIYYTHSGTKK